MGRKLIERTCVLCNKTFLSKGPLAKYCDDCKNSQEYKQHIITMQNESKKANAIARGRMDPVTGAVIPVKTTCSYCGQTFDAPRRGIVYCPDCRKNHAWEIRKLGQLRWREAQKKKKNSTKEVAEIAKIASDLGMSYGQYVSKLYMEGRKDVS